MDANHPNADNRNRIVTRLVEQYQGMLLRMCYVMLRDQELARDAVQETFLKAYRALDAFRGESSEKTWLTQIAMNTCRSMRRSAWFLHNDRRVTPEDLPQPAYTPNEHELDLMCDVMQLSQKLKEVILLYYWQEMTVEEIAQALSVAPSTVSTRLKQARGRLHNLLERRHFHV